TSPPLAEVLALAKQLEESDSGQMSLAELEHACAEIGLDARYVRRALAQLTREATHPSPRATRAPALGLPDATGVLRTKQELIAWIAAFWLPVVYCLLTLSLIPKTFAGQVVLPLLLSWVPGF